MELGDWRCTKSATSKWLTYKAYYNQQEPRKREPRKWAASQKKRSSWVWAWGRKGFISRLKWGFKALHIFSWSKKRKEMICGPIRRDGRWLVGVTVALLMERLPTPKTRRWQGFRCRLHQTTGFWARSFSFSRTGSVMLCFDLHPK